MWATEAFSRILDTFSVGIQRKPWTAYNLRASASSIYQPEHGNEKVEDKK